MGWSFFYHYDGHYKTFNKIYAQTVKLISINIRATIIILHKARWAITVLLFQTTQAKTNIIDSHDEIMYVNKHYYKLDDKTYNYYCKRECALLDLDTRIT
jgi:hypothetical protein